MDEIKTRSWLCRAILESCSCKPSIGAFGGGRYTLRGLSSPTPSFWLHPTWPLSWTDPAHCLCLSSTQSMFLSSPNPWVFITSLPSLSQLHTFPFQLDIYFLSLVHIACLISLTSKSRGKTLWPHNSCILNACKISTLWMPLFSASESSSWDHGYSNLAVSDQLAEHDVMNPVKTTSFAALMEQTSLCAPFSGERLSVLF
jgi:hypothetical protein